MKNSDLISALLQQIEEGYHSKAWHGTNLRGSLRGLSIDQLIWRQSPKRHNIWEIAVHCAYWKYVVRRRLTGERKGTFPLKGSNFFPRPVERTVEAWKKDIRLLDEMHFLLTEEIRNIPPARLSKSPKGSSYSYLQTISGIAMHDVYHAGQIQLIKRLIIR